MRLSPKIVIGVAGVAAALILSSLAQEMNRRLQVRREVVRLEEESRQLENRLVELEHLNQYFRTDAFQERMAREKLNYKAEGEKVVLIADPPFSEVPPVRDNAATAPVLPPVRWWRVFFGDGQEAAGSELWDG
ncbi:MAG: hypothetical protein COT71_00590 [Candidatus Andersenbacteria bacterium CG10_big_fil_rev_8_21_14_0_10_54_11]|uniref:Septum formation initiator n=1 Tax=Candidatus Andersenbacteria bacterium CG10_big_fil_rev_8_21_14_0_10_54_11 TaxID=1974485 RepID=A0A2M6X086_9BACT|nr:MAG: hypothetical protein COT71_00590 [Candidatus Andersenbacteria bacterium CG10_big_fil_rev_8_21_14_0_10_54_11]